MEKLLFQNVPVIDRRKMLSDNADKIEERGYMREFTPEEIEAMKDNLAEVSIKINDKEDQKKEILSDLKKDINPLVAEKKTLLKSIKEKAEFVNEECYKVIDHTDGVVGYYNGEGRLIESRPIRPDERQKSIFPLTGTNN